ncbi:MAG TPA: hypothetical protein VKT80_11615, partial [Chloroflexota bacterium]|nr:hypothetical protein [Chloroflexota bacterium]
MYRIPFPFTDTLLVLTPPLESLAGWTQLLLLFFGVVLSAALLIWLYSYEIRLINPLKAIGLLLLRGAVLAMLAFVCLQPVVSKPSSEKLHGRVLVALDRSDSIGVVDPQREIPEKLRLARGLNLAGDICRDDQIDAWLKQYDAKGQVNFPATPAGETERSLHNQVCSRVDATTRLQIAQQVMIGDRVNLLGALAKRHDVEIAGFSQEIGELKPE